MGANATLTCMDLFNESLPHPTNNAGGTTYNQDPQFADLSQADPTDNDYTATGSLTGCAGGVMGLNFTPDHVWVYNGWSSSSTPEVHGDSKIWNYNAFDNIADAVFNVDVTGPTGGTVTIVVDNDVACGTEDNDYIWNVNGNNYENIHLEIENGGEGTNTCSEHNATLTINNSAGSTPVQVGFLTLGNGTTIDLTGAMTVKCNLVLGDNVAVKIGDDPLKVEGNTEVGDGSYIETNDNGPLVLTLQPGVPTTFPLKFGGQYSPVIITSGITATFRVSGRLLGDNYYNTSTQCLWSIEGPNSTNSTIVFLYPQSVVPDDFDMNNLMCYRLVGSTWFLFGEPTTTGVVLNNVDYYRSEVTNVNNFSEWGIFDKDFQPVPLPWWAIALLGISFVATGGYYIFKRLV